MNRKNTPSSVNKKTNSSSLFSTPSSRLPTPSKVKPSVLKKFSDLESPAVDLNAAFSSAKITPDSSTRTPVKTLAKAKSSNSLNVASTPTVIARTLLSTPKSVKKSTENFQTPESSAKLSLYTRNQMAKSSMDVYTLSSAKKAPGSSARTPMKTLGKAKSSNSLNIASTPTAMARTLLSTPKSVKKSTENFQTPESSAKLSLYTRNRLAKSNMDVSTLSDKETNGGEISQLKVAVRVRPLNVKECKNPTVTNVVRVNGSEITVLANASADSFGQTHHCFQYDNAFWSCDTEHPDCADQAAVFEGTALPLVDKAFEGYNCCLFAYGQTGSGKSYSIMGIDLDDNEINAKTNSEAGIIPRFCQELFGRIKTLGKGVHAEVEVSYFEVYNEKIHDLLAVSPASSGTEHGGSAAHFKKPALKVREHPIWGPYVVDLSTHPVDSHAALRNWLAVGNSQRATFSTGMNDKSSRSHSIFNINLSLSDIVTDEKGVTMVTQTKRSKISLIDLAGSERLSHTCASGDRLKEGVSINKSLLTLGKVIAALADTSRKPTGFVPYRESVLTWLLRENLGGNSRTVMLATISPASQNLDETLATLRYACQARTIVNRVKVNEDPHDRIIRELRAEIERLQAMSQDYERQKRHSGTAAQPRKIIIETSTDNTEVEALRQQLADTEHELKRAQKSWFVRLEEAEEVRKTEMRLLKQKGLALELSAEQRHPCLVNLAVDPALSGILLYMLPPGVVKIGRPSTFSSPDIVLEGPMVAQSHCTIENSNNRLYLTPEHTEDYDTFVNGELVTAKRQLYHCDRLVIGGSHYFRVSNPNCTQRVEHKKKIIDFQVAQQEIFTRLEEKLREELEVEKETALEQIEAERVANICEYETQMKSLDLEKHVLQCNREVLEAEKEMLERKRLALEEDKFEYTPIGSSLLDEIKRIMEHPTQESLHQTQLMVREATRRCKNAGIDYEFKQTQKADEFGLFQVVVTIVDRQNQRVAEWPPARLDVWLSEMRDQDDNPPPAEHMFDFVELTWQEGRSLDESIFATSSNESISSPNSSRISLKQNAVKDAIFGPKQSQQPSLLTETLKSNMEKSKSPIKQSPPRPQLSDKENVKTPPNSNRTPPVVGTSFEIRANAYLKDMYSASMKLKRLCLKYQQLEATSTVALIRAGSTYTNQEKCLELTKQLLTSIHEIETQLDNINFKLADKEAKSAISVPKALRLCIT